MHIVQEIYHLSGTLRAKYKHVLKPTPFTWETFEHLGGLMKTHGEPWENMIVRNIAGNIVEDFFDEFLDIENTIEAAMPTIINNDIKRLRVLFTFIQKIENNEVHLEKLPQEFEFIAIKALTRRILDVENLVKLLKYSDNHVTILSRNEVFNFLNQLDQSKKYFVFIDNQDKNFARKIDLTSTIGKHAALRRLVMIGELLTGKYLSSFVKILDKSIDWEAFSILRDTIVHQDEKDNRAKVQALLDDNLLFERILGHDLQEFFLKLIEVIKNRHEQLPRFHGSEDNFWQAIYDYENQNYLQQQAAGQTPLSPKSNVTQEDIHFIQEALMEKNTDATIIEQWLKILKKELPRPDKKTLGQLRKHFPSRQEDKSKNAQCGEIINRVLYPKTLPDEKGRKRQQDLDDASKRRAAQQCQLSGLENIRNLAKMWRQQSNESFYLTPVYRVNLAIEALENIKLFIQEYPFIDVDFNYATLEEWGKNHTDNFGTQFAVSLISDNELSDALMYNAGQLLLHLDRISTFSEAKGNPFLDRDKEYETLRNLRNWIEHGNYFLDTVEHVPGKVNSPVLPLQRAVAGMMVRLIFQLLPTLYDIKSQLTERKNVCEIAITSAYMLWQPKENRNSSNTKSIEHHEPCTTNGF